MHSKPKLLIADSASGKFLPRVLERIDDNSLKFLIQKLRMKIL